jgi:muramoyltetrapeptide carboxypeptidase
VTRLKPNRLKPGDTLGIIAPSSPFQQDTFDQGLAVLQAMGFQTCLADGLFENQGYLAGSDERRSAQLQQMFADDSIQGIICARGGYGALRFLALLDFALIAKHPKPFIGFSDITALHQAFLTKANLVTFHGPMVCSLGKNDSASRKVMEDILTGMAVSKLMAAEPRPLRKGVAQGTVVGGNLATLCHLLATPFIQPLEGKVLLLEEVNEAPYRIDRVLTQMKMAGCFKGLAGVMVGQFEGCGPQELIEHILLDCFDDENLPIAAGFDVGHGQRNHTVVLGVQARLDTGRGILTYLEEPFEA